MQHSGVMVCLPLPALVADVIAIDGGEDSSDLHVTLAYIPNVGGDLEKRKLLQQAIAPLSQTLAPLRGMIGGTGRFNGSETSDFKDVFYASFDSAGLEALRRAVVDAVEKAGFEVSKKHGFTPHITLKYLDADEASPMLRPSFPEFEITELCLADRSSWTEFEFCGTVVLKGQPTASDVHVPAMMGAKKKRAKKDDADTAAKPAPVAPPQTQKPGWDPIPENNQDVGYEDAMKELVEAAVEFGDRAFIPIRKFNSKKQICYGVVLEPETEDLQGDTITEEEIEKTAHDYLAKARNIHERHKQKIEAYPVESYIAPMDLQFRGGPFGDQVIKKGSWVMGVKIEDPAVWAKVESGEYSGFSVGGLGVRDSI